MTTRRLAVAVVLGSGLAVPASAGHVVLVGGGDRPEPAMERFVALAGGAQARLLCVAWASGEPAESAQWLEQSLRPYGPAAIEVAPDRPLDAAGRARVLEQLARATGVFFGGGDQARIMDVFQDRALLDAFRERYAEGAVFAGTSAGAAIMSPVMIVGADGDDWTVIDADRVTTAEGLGLLPGTIVDQHFIKRQRENRLFGLILRTPELLGVGVDEDAAILVTDGRDAEVLGGTVMLVDGRESPGTLVVRLLQTGDRYDLVARRPVPGAVRPEPPVSKP